MRRRRRRRPQREKARAVFRTCLTRLGAREGKVEVGAAVMYDICVCICL